MIADTVRLIRHCQSDQLGMLCAYVCLCVCASVLIYIPDLCVCLLGNEVVGSDSPEVRASVHHLHIIDNQQTLFQLSHKLEPRA